ncbi:unnamed protein product [Discula destructiva]
MPTLKGKIPDPRPSRAHPEQRKLRKELEKEHGYGWLPPVILGLLGLTLAYDVAKDVEKHEEKHKREEEEAERRRRRRRRREREARYGSPRHRRRHSFDADQEHQQHDDGDDDDGGDYEGRDRDYYQAWKEAGLERAESAERGEAYDAKFDGGLDRADLLEKGEGRVYRRRRDDELDPYEYSDHPDYSRGRRQVDERRTRPRPRRRSSDW